MEKLVPKPLAMLEAILELLSSFAQPDMARCMKPVTVVEGRMIFDLKWFVNLTYFPDFYIPILPDRQHDAALLAHRLWAMMIGGEPLPYGFAGRLFDCVDTAQETSQGFIERLFRLIKQLEGR